MASVLVSAPSSSVCTSQCGWYSFYSTGSGTSLGAGLVQEAAVQRWIEMRCALCSDHSPHGSTRMVYHGFTFCPWSLEDLGVFVKTNTKSQSTQELITPDSYRLDSLGFDAHRAARLHA